MRLDSMGDLVELKFIGDTNSTHHFFGYEFHPIAGTSDFIFVGTTDSAGYYQILLRRYDSDFETVWTKVYGDSNYQTLAYSVQYDPTNEGFIVCGQRRNTSSTKTEVYLLFARTFGDSVWAESYQIGTDSLDVGRSVKLDGSGYAVTGYTYSDDRYDGFLLLTDSEGGHASSYTYGDANTGQFAESIKKTSDGGFIIVGGGMVDTTNDVRAIATKTNSSGSVSWTTGFGTSGSSNGFIFDYAQGVIEKQDTTGFYIVGVSDKGYYDVDDFRSADVLVAEIDTLGNVVWERAIPDSLAGYGYWIQPTNDDGFVICGSAVNRTVDSAFAFAMKISPGWDCGDVNDDGNVNIIDLTYLVDFFDRRGPAPPILQQANVDGSCPLDSVTTDDRTYLLNYIFYSGPAPTCPWCFEE